MKLESDWLGGKVPLKRAGWPKHEAFGSGRFGEMKSFTLCCRRKPEKSVSYRLPQTKLSFNADNFQMGESCSSERGSGSVWAPEEAEKLLLNRSGFLEISAALSFQWTNSPEAAAYYSIIRFFTFQLHVRVNLKFH